MGPGKVVIVVQEKPSNVDEEVISDISAARTSCRTVVVVERPVGASVRKARRWKKDAACRGWEMPAWYPQAS
jgi:hypothetical protein